MTTKTVLAVHPKVFASAVTGILATVVTAVAANLDPSVFDFLPVGYRAAAILLIGTLLSGLAGWLKRAGDEPAPEASVVVPDVSAPTVTVTNAIVSPTAPATD